MTADRHRVIEEPDPKKHRPLARTLALEPAAQPLRFMTVSEVAELLRTTPKAIYARIERGLLPGVVKDGRRRLVERKVLIEWLAKRRATSLGEPKR